MAGWRHFKQGDVRVQQELYSNTLYTYKILLILQYNDVRVERELYSNTLYTYEIRLILRYNGVRVERELVHRVDASEVREEEVEDRGAVGGRAVPVEGRGVSVV